jgi:hypothetical protein
MGRSKGSLRTPGSGRKTGTPNRVTAELREMTHEALHLLGGINYLVSLGKEQPAVFGALLRRCMPQAVEARFNSDLPIVTLDFAGSSTEDTATLIRKTLEPEMINQFSEDQLRMLGLDDEPAERGI